MRKASNRSLKMYIPDKMEHRAVAAIFIKSVSCHKIRTNSMGPIASLDEKLFVFNGIRMCMTCVRQPRTSLSAESKETKQ
jgi:hypothetical protein